MEHFLDCACRQHTCCFPGMWQGFNSSFSICEMQAFAFHVGRFPFVLIVQHQMYSGSEFILHERLLCGFSFGCLTAVVFPIPQTGIGMRSNLLVHVKYTNYKQRILHGRSTQKSEMYHCTPYFPQTVILGTWLLGQSKIFAKMERTPAEDTYVQEMHIWKNLCDLLLLYWQKYLELNTIGWTVLYWTRQCKLLFH